MSYPQHQRPQAAFPTPHRSKKQIALTLEELDALHPSFRDHARYVLNHSALTVKTYAASYANFRRFLVETQLPSVPLIEQVQDLDRWVTWNRKRGASAVTTNSYWRAVRPFFHYLEKTQGLPNPYHGAHTPPIPKHRLPKALKPEQLERVMAAARHYPWRTILQRERATALIGIMLYAGLRKGEVLRLQFADVNLADGSIQIVAGKGRFGGKDRTVYMPGELRAILTRYLAIRRKMHFTCPEFFVTRGNRGLSEMQFRRIVRQVREAAGVPLFAHALRHSYITMLLRSRVPIHVVQSLAGHADITTTALYTATWDEDKRAAVQRLRISTRPARAAR
jgi:site-specific recombinase XerD